jgi:hypothetical protein
MVFVHRDTNTCMAVLCGRAPVCIGTDIACFSSDIGCLFLTSGLSLCQQSRAMKKAELDMRYGPILAPEDLSINPDRSPL